MLAIGFVYKNVSFIDIGEDVIEDWSTSLRNIALVIILTRAGLGLDLANLRKLSVTCLRLAAIPNIIEACVDAFLATVLFDMPWKWGLMLGFVISAVSPAVVVPSLLSLQDAGYGVEKGIPTLVLAAASFDDVISISAFGAFLGLAFSNGSVVEDILRGPMELTMGLCFGFIGAFVCHWVCPTIRFNEKKKSEKTNLMNVDVDVTTSKSENSKIGEEGEEEEEISVSDREEEEDTDTDKDSDRSHEKYLRTVLLLGMGLVAVFGGKRIDYTGGGALSVIVLGVVCAKLWGPEATKDIKEHTSIMWKHAQPFLFVLIGAAVDADYLTGDFVLKGGIILFCGLAIRFCVTLLCAKSKTLTFKEMIFISLAWLPKATVQAAIGSVALDTAREQNPIDPEEEDFGKKILTLAVLSILITAPVGAIAIALSGPKLLTKKGSETSSSESEAPVRNSIPPTLASSESNEIDSSVYNKV
eukprot:TRINITY_DN777947_c0_g1_i1.p1 TRINITY_DN777947_c0_g1~~TRINITY_DN777947_c0_g1_i1.p1  ORF type:complete len:471 (+),score=153.75 TRINITY_DN777947_c0_g1_i1:278-1690(+)